MRIIYNKFIPFKGYSAMMFFGVILARIESKPLPKYAINHEHIHKTQAKDCGGYLLYYLTYIYQWVTYGYRNCPFELEAYKNQYNLSYLKHRPYKAWRNYK